ncbi:DUF1501 domain-containing protein [Vibrio chagasii]|uniref:DUF1501 domain-containing protein n=1 Tax=Vibrio chagasii TaxID=170679 RepID=UPI003735CE4B
MDRRDFLKILPSSIVLSSGAVISNKVFSGVRSKSSSSSYKALVVVELNGGNDSLNMLVPTTKQDNFDRETYDNNRSEIRISNDSLVLPTQSELDSGSLDNKYLDGAPSSSSSSYLPFIYKKGVYNLSDSNLKFGVNGVMPELAYMIENGDASVLGNLGTLTQPIPIDGTPIDAGLLPPYLFAHNNQRRVIKTGMADNIAFSGWGSRALDYLGYNSGQFGGISTSGSTRLLQGPNNGLSMSNKKPSYLKNLDTSIFDALNTTDSNSPFSIFSTRLLKNSNARMESIQANWGGDDFYGTSKGSYGELLHDVPNSESGFDSNNSLSGQLIDAFDTVARMIKITQNTAGLSPDPIANQQVFFISFGGWDHHSNASYKHPKLLRELSLGLWKFKNMLSAIGYENDVTTVTYSDFGRTLQENNDGSDHAWASQQIIMGNPINGGRLFGELPILEPGSASDINDSGRYIPTLSYDQLWASCIQWLGVDESALPLIFPNIDNFSSRTIPGLFV